MSLIRSCFARRCSMTTKTAPEATTRITVKVPRDLHRAVRVLGIETGKNLTDLVVLALRRMLAEGRKNT